MISKPGRDGWAHAAVGVFGEDAVVVAAGGAVQCSFRSGNPRERGAVLPDAEVEAGTLPAGCRHKGEDDVPSAEC